MLHIRNLHAAVSGVEILKGIDLNVRVGEVHAIMGPNGSGKSTLANVLAGHPSFTVTSGELLFEGNDLRPMVPEARARAGIFLSFQHPIEIPGVRFDQFLRAGYNALRKGRGEDQLDVLAFNRFLKKKLGEVGIDPALIQRNVNEGFSGGEKKRMEILQLAVLEPKLAILDEVDSGLDVDALREVAQGINHHRRPDNAIILVTHYNRILNYVEPDFVHIIVDGRIVRSGDKGLALEIEADGYDKYEVAAKAISAGAR